MSANSASACQTRAEESPKRASPTFSIASIAESRPPIATAGPGWGWQSPSVSWSCTAARSRRRAGSTPGRRLRFRFSFWSAVPWHRFRRRGLPRQPVASYRLESGGKPPHSKETKRSSPASIVLMKIKLLTIAFALLSVSANASMVHPFDQLKGVVKVTSGYAGVTGHRESVEVIYDPRQVNYATLLEVFWHNVDPTNNDGQFCDHGTQYRSAIFYQDAEQKQLAEASKAALQKRMQVYTDILPAATFYAAEEYHQDYYKKNPVRYRFYRLECGRDHRLQQIWGSAAGH